MSAPRSRAHLAREVKRMTITSKADGRKLRIFLSGELDHHAAREAVTYIEDKLETQLPRDCVLDMG